MKQSLLAFLLLAFGAMTVMSMPTSSTSMLFRRVGTKDRSAVCKARKGLAKKAGINKGKVPVVAAAAAAKGAGAAAAPKGAGAAAAPKGAPAQGAGAAVKGKKVRKTKRDVDSWIDLGERAGGSIKLCGYNLRMTPASRGQGKAGFGRITNGAPLAWHDWNDYSAHISNYQVDHALELQLVARALEHAGFCTALNSLKAGWKHANPAESAGIDTWIKQQFDSYFKPTANSMDLFFFALTSFNNDKGHWFSNFANGIPVHASSSLTAYYSLHGLVATIDTAAQHIDQAAHDLLTNIYEAATEGVDCETEEGMDYAVLMGSYAVLTEANPVSTSWAHAKTTLGI